MIESLPRFTGARCARPALVESINDRNEAQDDLAKAQESLPGTASELAHQHFNNGARAVYYACFQEAIAALLNEELFPRSLDHQWGHDFVQARFVRHLIRCHWRKRYPVQFQQRFLGMWQTLGYANTIICALAHGGRAGYLGDRSPVPVRFYDTSRCTTSVIFNARA